jgi:hypothetical protein
VGSLTRCRCNRQCQQINHQFKEILIDYAVFQSYHFARSQSNCSSLSSRDFASAWVTTVYMATDGAGMAHTTAVVPSPHTPSNKLIGFARFTQVVLVLAGGVRTPGPPPPPLSYAPAQRISVYGRQYSNDYSASIKALHHAMLLQNYFE